MRVVEAEEDKTIKNVKCYDNSDNIRLTWNWGQGVQQVYIFTEGLNVNETDANAENFSNDGKLFTLQEYKKQGGCILPKNAGAFVYYIYPFQRVDGEDILYDQPHNQNQISYTCKTTINVTIVEKAEPTMLSSFFSSGGRYKNHEVTLTSNYNVSADIIGYVKNENAPPTDINDGTTYLLGEPLQANQPLTRIIRTERNEYLNLFIPEEHSTLYTLQK
ncbi:MAG: hypothetical protein FWC89_01995 [Defluviitaleaceae bacterium]|nr:hypothetical protein [Defluviitaleaceae bacterium]